jgi:hypothetical protein
LQISGKESTIRKIIGIVLNLLALMGVVTHQFSIGTITACFAAGIMLFRMGQRSQ